MKQVQRKVNNLHIRRSHLTLCCCFFCALPRLTTRSVTVIAWLWTTINKRIAAGSLSVSSKIGWESFISSLCQHRLAVTPRFNLLTGTRTECFMRISIMLTHKAVVHYGVKWKAVSSYFCCYLTVPLYLIDCTLVSSVWNHAIIDGF